MNLISFILSFQFFLGTCQLKGMLLTLSSLKDNMDMDTHMWVDLLMFHFQHLVSNIVDVGQKVHATDLDKKNIPAAKSFDALNVSTRTTYGTNSEKK